MKRHDLTGLAVVHGRTVAGYVLGVLGLAALAGAGLVLLSMLGGCSTGPQTVPQTTPINIACTWNAQDGGAIEDCDCLVDRATSGAEATTTGNVVRDVTVSPDIRTSVSPIP